MRRTLLTVTVVWVLLGSGAWGQTKHSAVGTWKVDIAHSEFGAGEKPKSITVVVLKDSPKMLSWRVRGVDGNGKAFAYSWSGPEDGTMRPVMQDGKEISKQSAKREEDGALLRHGEDPDGSSFDARSRMSEDGNSMNEETTTKEKDGKESKQKAVYLRVSMKKKTAA
jgi:hypothetical protein